MSTLREGNLEHRFEHGWLASKYDEWPFYQEHFKDALGGNKAVDFVAHDLAAGTLWLVELKDYRLHPRTKVVGLAEETAAKVRDSLAGLVAAATWHSDHARLADARHHLGARKLRVVLQLEQPARPSKLFPRQHELATLQQRLKQLVKVVDAHPLVVDLDTVSRLPWSVGAVSGEQS